MAKVTGATNSDLEVVATADSIGKCTEEGSDEMKFATKENAIFACSDSGRGGYLRAYGCDLRRDAGLRSGFGYFVQGALRGGDYPETQSCHKIPFTKNAPAKHSQKIEHSVGGFLENSPVLVLACDFGSLFEKLEQVVLLRKRDQDVQDVVGFELDRASGREQPGVSGDGRDNDIGSEF